MSIIVKIDLKSKSHTNISLDEKILKKHLGGRGLGAYLYEKNVKMPNDPENSVLIVPGLLTGTMFPSSSRSEVVSSSPLTNYYMASSFGGVFGAYLKQSGILALEITGRSKDWLYIVIENKTVKFYDAKNLVGKGVFETQNILKSKFPKKQVSIAAIGQAGENLVRFSTLMVDKRAAGRGGTGWHFGYKKVKAIVIVKTPSEMVPTDFTNAQKIIHDLIKKKLAKDKDTPTYCTPAYTNWANDVQAYPASNYRRNFVSVKELKKLDRDEYGKYKLKSEACWSCPLACTRIVKDNDNKEVRGPEYESIWSLGASCDNFDLPAIVQCNKLCDDYGMDTISTGSILAWYKECIDKKLIKDSWSSKRMYEIISEIAVRKNLGSKLADGIIQAVENFGFGEELAVHSKGLDLPAWDPRVAIGMSINYATASTGGDHCKGWTVESDLQDSQTQFATEGKAKNAVVEQNISALVDSLGTCTFANFLYNDKVRIEIIKSYFGWEIIAGKLEKLGNDIIELEHIINKKLGHTLKENVLPPKIINYEVKVNGKKVKLTQSMFDTMMRDYLTIRNWKD